MKNGIKKNIVHFGLDHLEIFVTCKHEIELFSALDFDNSNVGELEDYVYVKTEVKNYAYKILFMHDSYPVFAFYKGDKEANIPTRDYLVVHGTAFKILKVEEIRYFIEGYFENISHLRRFDICFDSPYFIIDILKHFPRYKGKGAIFNDENGDPATQYFGEKQRGKNKRHIIRVYNKILDLVQSKKIKLFRGYFQFDVVTRIELEVRAELAKNISYDDIWKQEIQQAIFKNYLGKRTKLFEFLPVDKLSLFKKKEIAIYGEEYQSIYYKTQRKNIFIGHAKAIAKLGFCPVRVLIGEHLYTPTTKRILGGDLVEHIINMEQKLKKDFYLRVQKNRDFKNLLDNSPEYEGDIE